MKYNQLDASVVETSIHSESQLDGLDELKHAEPKLLADMLLGFQAKLGSDHNSAGLNFALTLLSWSYGFPRQCALGLPNILVPWICLHGQTSF